MNVFERKRASRALSNQYVTGKFTKVLQPKITEGAKDYFMHDKLNVRDIDGTVADTYKKYKQFKGRDTLAHTDIEKSLPA